MILPVVLGLSALGGLMLANKRSSDSGKSTPPELTQKVLESLADASKITVLPESRWAEVPIGQSLYRVNPVYIGPVGIGEALRIAKAHGCELPTPEMVDAIWNAADLKVEPHPEAHDGTLKTMNSPELNVRHLAFIDKQIEDKCPSRDFKLLAGTHKDVVMTKDGKLGLYGWHKLDGKKIQGLFLGHSPDWKDYSQGLRLLKRVETVA